MAEYTDSEPAQLAITTVQCLLIIFNIVGNSLVCVIITKNQDMRTPVNYLLMNLAITDITVATFFAVEHIFTYTFTHPDGVTGRVLCSLLTGGNLAWVGAAASVLCLVFIAIERYCAVIYPHWNKGKLTNRRLKVIIPCSWIFGVFMSIPGFLCEQFDKKVDSCAVIWPANWMSKAHTLTWLLIMSLMPVALMVVLYSRAMYALWFKRAETNENDNRQQGVIKVRKRVTLMVIIVSVVFGVCWLTSSITYVLYDYSPSHAVLSYAATNTMILFNSAINPIVYALVNQRFREKFKRMMCCSCQPATNIVHPARESQMMEVAFDPTHPTQETGEN